MCARRRPAQAGRDTVTQHIVSVDIWRGAYCGPFTICLRYLVGTTSRTGPGHNILRRLRGDGRGAAADGEQAMGWTDERVEILKKLWLDGLSASQIAKQLGGVTRNAVIGKVHRLGLSGRAAPSQPARPAFKAPRPPRPVTPAPRRPAGRRRPHAPAPPAPAPFVEQPGSATVLTLGAHMCKWPIGDPSTDDFTFCGRRAGERAPTASTTPASPTSRSRARSAPARPTWPARCGATSRALFAPSASRRPERSGGARCARHDRLAAYRLLRDDRPCRRRPTPRPTASPSSPSP